MRIKKTLMYCALAAAMLLSSCGEKNTSSAPSTAVSGSGEYTVKSEKPKEIEGFEGNLKDVKPKSGDLIATFEIEGYDGAIKAVLFPQAAPVGVENFQKLCDKEFFKGLKIHRVVKNFMFQGGSTNGDGTGGDALVNNGSFGIETAQNARHFYGALCYANAGGQNSTQFYIVNNKQPQDISDFDADRNQSVVDANVSYINENVGQVNQAQLDNALFEQQYNQNTIDYIKGATDEIKTLYKEKGGTPSLDGNYTVFGQVYEGFDVIDKLSSVEVADNGGGEKSKPVKDIIIKNVTVSTFE